MTLSKYTDKWNRSGMSLVEVMAVLCILSTITALLLPAVMNSRQSALRMKCTNHLKQVELATIQYHEVNNAFPAYDRLGTPNHRPDIGRSFSVFSRIAPYLEQVNVYNQTNFQVELHDEVTVNSGRVTETSFGSPANSTVMRTSLSVLVCPSDPSPIDSSTTRGTNYRANFGTEATYGADLSHAGPFSLYTTLAASGVTDGLSNTVAYSEKARGNPSRLSFDSFVDTLVDPNNPDPPASFLFEYCSSQPITSATYRTTTGINWLIGGLTQSCYNHMDVPNGPTPDCVRPGNMPGTARATARSYHGAGANVVMADGSVRFVKSSIDIATWKALGTRANGEVATYDD